MTFDNIYSHPNTEKCKEKKEIVNMVASVERIMSELLVDLLYNLHIVKPSAFT